LLQRSRLLWLILRRLALAIALALIVAGGSIWAGAIVVPAHINPLAPLRVGDEVGLLTRFKLSRLERNGPECLVALRDAPVVHKPVSDRRMSEGCGFSNAVEVTRSSVAFSRSFTATCPLMVAWALFETHVLHPAARRHLGQDVARVTHLGTYACRNINHREAGRRSEHASANAIDISGFVLADGRQISLEKDWTAGDLRRTAFLREVRDGACEFFDVVLGPDYNEAHRDHFHFDMGGYRACR
jgi:hypothetical protein